jgi:hypothetical protein
MSTYRVILVDPGGRTITELTSAKVDHVTWELNAPGEAVYRLPILHPEALDAKNRLLRCEVQVWRDGELIFWGIPVAMRGDVAAAEFLAFGLLYYFATRYFGPVYSNAMPPMAVNGTFEANPVSSGWSPSSPAPTITPSTNRYSGSQCVRLTGGGSAGTPYYIYQFVTMPTPARSQPLKVTASAWCYPEGITAYGIQDRGLEVQWNGATPPSQQWSLLNANVPDRRWTRMETSLDIPANAADTCTLALFAPLSGSVCWDQFRFTYEQKTGAIAGEDWVDDYLRRVFNYGAGNTGGGSTGPGGSTGSQTSWWGANVLKSSLGMNFFPQSLAAGSVPIDTFWPHEDAGNILEAMLEVPKRDKADIEITWNRTGTSRGLTPFIPRKGSVKPALAVELRRNITAFSYDIDGRQSANDVRVVGRNSGNTKEVGQAGGPFPATLGGTQFETIITPPQEVDGQGLIDTAVTAERQIHDPVILPTITAKAAGLLDTTNVGGPLVVGDMIPVRMSYGAIQENDVRRVVKMTLKPATEEVELVLNVVA